MLRPVRRLQLVELEDQPWVPRSIRNGGTDVLDVLLATTGVYRPLAPALAAFMTTVGLQRWLDLCSGGGGGALVMRAELVAAGGEAPAVTLTDRYPNEAARQRVAALGDPGVLYGDTPVDALNVGPQAPAIRTMFSALHHFPPDDVRHILQAAIAAGAPLAFVDVAASPTLRRVPMALVPFAALPNFVLLFLLALALVPVARPFRWSRLGWTYLLPAIPCLFAWDGTVSALRAYTPDELLALAQTVPGGTGYRWHVAHHGQALMLTGHPVGQ
jgi:hypothetical protein